MGLAENESILKKKKKKPLVRNNAKGSGAPNHPFQLKECETEERTAQVKQKGLLHVLGIVRKSHEPNKKSILFN